MKLFIFGLALFAIAYADVSELPSSDYLPPAASAPAPVPVSAPAPAPVSEYLPPAAPVEEVEPAHELSSDGYRYKTHRQRRIRYRQRRYRHRV